MGDIYTDPPYPNGADSDNTLLFKIARYLWGGGGGAAGGLTDTQLRATPVPVASGSKQYSTSSNATVGTTNADVFTLAAGQAGSIQNVDDAVLFVKLGTGCSTSSYTWALKAGSAAADGLGGNVYIDNWIGVVSVCAATGTASYLATKLS